MTKRRKNSYIFLFAFQEGNMVLPNMMQVFGSSFTQFDLSAGGSFRQTMVIRRTKWKLGPGTDDDCLNGQVEINVNRCVVGHVERVAKCTLPILDHNETMKFCEDK